jgi:heterodisulfide reductase subunit B
VKHFVDFMWDNVGESTIREKIKKPLNGLQVVCYYGCLSVRPPLVTDVCNYEDPRTMDHVMEVLGAEVKNWSYKTDCCGGSLILTRPDIADKMTRKLFDMALEAGAECIVVGCPMCFSNLDSWQKRISEESGTEYKIPVYYFSELMGVAFDDPAAQKWLGRHVVDPKPLLKEKGLI